MVVEEVEVVRTDKDKENALSTDSGLRSELPRRASNDWSECSLLTLTTLLGGIIETDGNEDFHAS